MGDIIGQDCSDAHACAHTHLPAIPAVCLSHYRINLIFLKLYSLDLYSLFHCVNKNDEFLSQNINNKHRLFGLIFSLGSSPCSY